MAPLTLLTDPSPLSSGALPGAAWTTLGAGLVLVSWWKPLLALVFFVAWAWIVATIFDKDAQRFYLKRRQWNIAHALAGMAALTVFLGVPIFVAALPAMLVILGTDLGAYFYMRNNDHRVGEANKWSLSPGKWMASSKEEKDKDKRAKDVSLVFRTKQGVIEAPEKETPEFAIRAAAEDMIIRSMDARAGRFDLAPVSEQTYSFSYVVDGQRQAGSTMSAPEAVAAIDFLKKAAGLDIADRRKRQVGDIAMERLNIKHKLRLTTMGAQGGMRIGVVIDPEKQVQRKIEELGLLNSQKEELEKIIKDEQGVVIIGAPPGQGRTSTMYAILRAHDAYTTNVQTMEIEPQGVIEGVRHNVFDPAVDGAEYSTTVRSLLRRDPDVLAIAEMPDANTGVEVSKADSSRTRVYLGLRADNALGAIQTYVKAVNDPAIAARGLHGVVAQKLLRRLCPNCRAAYQPSADMLKKMGLPADKVTQLFRKGGQVLIKNKPETCPMCAGGGYLGQEGVFEVHALGQEERDLIAKGDYASLKAALKKKRLPGIQESALKKAVEGVTSVEEVIRISAPPAAPGAGSAPQRSAPAAS